MMLNKILNDDYIPQRETEDVVLDPLMESIETISTASIRAFVRAILLAAPKWFWSAPVSLETEDFFEEELKEGGLVLHLKRVLRTFDVLAVSSNLTPSERDKGKAAIMIGHIDRYKDDGEGGLEYNLWNAFSVGLKIDKIVEFNALWGKDGASNTLAISAEDVEDIKRIIRVQDGKWTTPPEIRPRNTLELMYHQALYITSAIKWILEEEDDLGFSN